MGLWILGVLKVLQDISLSRIQRSQSSENPEVKRMSYKLSPNRFTMVPKTNLKVKAKKSKRNDDLVLPFAFELQEDFSSIELKSDFGLVDLDEGKLDENLATKSKNRNRKKTRKTRRKECVHTSVSQGCVCEGCGCHTIELDFRPKYDPKGSRRMTSSDPGCTTMVVDGVAKTFESSTNLTRFPKNIVAEVSRLYKEVAVVDGVVRGNKRKGILAACLMAVQAQHNEYSTEKHITDSFGISKKELTEGIKLVQPHKEVIIPGVKDLVKTHARNIGMSCVEEINKASRFAHELEGTHQDFNRSSNSSVAAGLLYLFLELKPAAQKDLDITFTLKNFASAVNVSEATLQGIIVKARGVYLGARD